MVMRESSPLQAACLKGLLLWCFHRVMQYYVMQLHYVFTCVEKGDVEGVRSLLFQLHEILDFETEKCFAISALNSPTIATNPSMRYD